MHSIIRSTLLGIGCVALACVAPNDSVQEGASSPRPPLSYLATAAQKGPVGYRDPAGGVSRDGSRLAFTQGRSVLVQPLAGGGTRVLGPAPSQVRYVAWLPDGRLAVHERAFDLRTQGWVIYDVETGDSEVLWPGRNAQAEPSLSRLLELNWSSDGDRVAGVTRQGGTSSVWVLTESGAVSEEVAQGTRMSYPVFSPTGELACIDRQDGRQELQLPCGGGPIAWMEGQEVYGHVAFSPDGAEIYYATPNASGVLDVWVRPVGGGAGTMIAAFSRDAYEPGVTRDGRLVFKTQDYRIFLATAPSEGGETLPLTSFQSETPSWSPDGSQVAFTFGGWRIATDDINYPDIRQHIGIINVAGEWPIAEPAIVVRQSESEDQGMAWSPNQEWLVYHSHLNGTDDVFLVPADGSTEPRIISEGGYETGWPRWSADGTFISFPTYAEGEDGVRVGSLFVIPVDQETGETGPQRRIQMGTFTAEVLQADWTADSRSLVFEAAEAAGKKSLYEVALEGGDPRRFHSWNSDQVHSGVSVSPNSRWAAYIGPDEEGFFQVFRVPLAGGPAEQLTFDPTQKTQPAYDPLGERVAFAVFSYKAHFWAR